MKSAVDTATNVRIFDATFGYEENKTIRHELLLYAKLGWKIAFVGAIGASKTTITNPINRFYDVTDGKIRYDGININEIRRLTFDEALRWFCRTRSFSSALSWKTSITAVLT